MFPEEGKQMLLSPSRFLPHRNSVVLYDFHLTWAVGAQAFVAITYRLPVAQTGIKCISRAVEKACALEN